MARLILVVDDDATFRELAGRVLTGLGMSVVGEADTVAQAIATAEAVRPDAALVDIELPDGNGIDLAQRLSALPWSPTVVLTSVDAEAAGPDDLARSGATGFVRKADLADGRLRSLLATD
jgi:CheY-like chemotaxis protein